MLADQLMKDESFINKIKAMYVEGSKYDEKGRMTYILFGCHQHEGCSPPMPGILEGSQHGIIQVVQV